MPWNLPTLAEIEAERHGKPLTKPSKVARIEKKVQAKAEVSKARAKADKADKARLAAIREACYERDKGQCRACGAVLYLRHENPLLVAESHHQTYRSRQGSDEISNRLILCKADHEHEHRGLLEISGDPNETLTFRELDKLTGAELRRWESPVPR